MKLPLMLILIMITTAGITQAQQTTLDKPVSLKVVNTSIEEALKQITHDHQVNFYYADLPGLTRRVTITTTAEPLGQVLKRLLQDTDITFKMVGQKVVLLPRKTRKHTIHGYIKDAESGEALIGASIYEASGMSGSEANIYGFYSITLPEDTVALQFSFVGYEPQRVRFFMDHDTVVHVRLTGMPMLEEIVVEGKQTMPIHESVNMSTVTIPVSQIKALPALLGENDVLKVLQLTPGVQSGNEGTSGLYVRGGGPDQNLILLDGVAVYNASHLFGFFSIFNADAINRVELIKGGFPARYGGRLSSVIEVNTKDGNMEKWQGEASAGILSSKITVEGPLQKKRTSVVFSARRTYLDLLSGLFQKDDDKQRYNFHDLNFKLSHIVNSRNRIYLSAYQGGDRFNSTKQYYGSSSGTYDNHAGLKWHNEIASLRWNSILTPKLFSYFTATYTGYHFETISNDVDNVTYGGGSARYSNSRASSVIEDLAAHADFDFSAAPAHMLKFGAGITHHDFTPGRYDYASYDGVTNIQQNTITQTVGAWELDAYASDEMKISETWAVNAGVHFSGFSVQDQTYTSLQPRLSARYLLTPSLSIKASYAAMTQFMHLLVNSGGGLPNDLWVPSTAKVKPQRSQQVALGMAKTLASRYEVTAEAYYKRMHNLVEYKDGASFTTISTDRNVVIDPDKEWEDKIYSDGRGDCYGAEFFFQKKTGKLTGWIGYTLSWNYRQFDELNDGKRFPYRYDRRHDISTALMYAWSDRVSFSAAWTFGTGNAITLPEAFYRDAYTPDFLNRYYPGRNAYRMPRYHRLDISASFKKNKKWGQRLWTVGVYNVYNRQNPYYVDTSWLPFKGVAFTQHSLFPAIPFLSYSIKF